jgi:hypothetical protein
MSDIQTLSRAKAARMIQTLDVIGMTLCADCDANPTPENVKQSCIALLRMMRDQVASTYKLEITSLDSLTGDVSKCLTPAEEAELVCDDLENDLTDE